MSSGVLFQHVSMGPEDDRIRNKSTPPAESRALRPFQFTSVQARFPIFSHAMTELTTAVCHRPFSGYEPLRPLSIFLYPHHTFPAVTLALRDKNDLLLAVVLLYLHQKIIVF